MTRTKQLRYIKFTIKQEEKELQDTKYHDQKVNQHILKLERDIKYYKNLKSIKNDFQTLINDRLSHSNNQIDTVTNSVAGDIDLNNVGTPYSISNIMFFLNTKDFNTITKRTEIVKSIDEDRKYFSDYASDSGVEDVDKTEIYFNKERYFALKIKYNMVNLNNLPQLTISQEKHLIYLLRDASSIDETSVKQAMNDFKEAFSIIPKHAKRFQQGCKLPNRALKNRAVCAYLLGMIVNTFANKKVIPLYAQVLI